MRIALIIAAGGSGERFRNEIKNRALPDSSSKLFFELGGRPVLMHPLACFQTIPQIRERILVVPGPLRKEVSRLLGRFRLENYRIVSGGKTRAESVLKGLRALRGRHEWIMVHDAARPFVDKEQIRQLIKAASKADGAVLAEPAFATMKAVRPETSLIERTVDRRILFAAQTPQLVKRSLLEKAYRLGPQALQATDEASLLEALRAEVRVAVHKKWNPKITTYQDLELAQAYWNSLNGKSLEDIRTGLGQDFHRLVKGRPFYLGGVRIRYDKGAEGHSDGDTLLHAVTDAILGATASGDIGRWFSDKDPRYRNIRSEKLLKEVYGKMKRLGWRARHVDTVVSLERPKLAPYRDKIRTSLARMLEVPLESVSVKAKTREGLGPVGEGLAVSCDALVTMIREKV